MKMRPAERVRRKAIAHGVWLGLRRIAVEHCVAQARIRRTLVPLQVAGKLVAENGRIGFGCDCNCRREKTSDAEQAVQMHARSPLSGLRTDGTVTQCPP